MSALSSKEKQEGFRARRAMLGQTEVRGIYLPPELHADLKSLARLWAERLERARAKDQAASEPSEG